jgi:hypothetical protein
VSAYRILPAERREQVLAETGRLLYARGGGIDMVNVSDLFLARPPLSRYQRGCAWADSPPAGTTAKFLLIGNV